MLSRAFLESFLTQNFKEVLRIDQIHLLLLALRLHHLLVDRALKEVI